LLRVLKLLERSVRLGENLEPFGMCRVGRRQWRMLPPRARKPSVRRMRLRWRDLNCRRTMKRTRRALVLNPNRTAPTWKNSSTSVYQQ
jgi:hypothetical protein